MKIYLSEKKKAEIKEVFIKSAFSSDLSMTIIAGNENLFGQAYFGFSATRYQIQKLRSIWHYLLLLSLELNTNLREWQKEQIRTNLQLTTNN
jgi:hypothetical protein